MPLTATERRDAAKAWQKVSAEANAAALDVKRDDLPLTTSLQHYASIQEQMTSIIQQLVGDEVD